MVTLREKFRGCIAASWTGSAMGAVVEGWSPQRIQETHGTLDRLLPYKHYTASTDWQRPPGTTEDGIERQKLMATAIMEKEGPVVPADLVAVWLRDLEPEKMRFKQEPFDRSLLELARAGVPPAELGRLWPFPNVVSMARAAHPLGLIHAGDPSGAADNCLEVGKVYMAPGAFGLRWAALYVAAIAEACKPQATVQSVLQTARRFAPYRAEAGALCAHYDSIEREVDRALRLADEHPEPAALRDAFGELYAGGGHVTYGMSQANEIVSKGLALFALSGGKPRQAIVAAVNFGRDTDCLAAVAGGLAGALGGRADLPDEWLRQVDEATRQDLYTHSRRTIEQTADGLLGAFLATTRRQRALLDAVGDPAYFG
ncbi:MAG: ADP-ribosylglycohydrolase family protein [Candidatus Brocadiia bacterium]